MSSRLGKLRPEVKAKWVTALRSGAYMQGRSYLRRGDEFCCLGVLCDLAVKDGVDIRVYTSDVDDEGVTYYDGESDFPSELIADWAYQQEPSGSARRWMVTAPNEDPEYEDEEPLAGLNDEREFSFAQIADLIEASL